MDIKNHVKSWRLWLVVSIVLGIMVFQKDGELSGLLPYAAILICPITMMFMMSSHKGHEKPEDNSPPSQHSSHFDTLK